MQEVDELIFVYNADGNFVAGLTDFAHKAISPGTYACNLCKITYGTFAMKNEWKEFLAGLPQGKSFLHRDEFRKGYPQFKETELPAILARAGGEIVELVPARELNAQEGLEQLKGLVENKLKAGQGGS